MNEASKNFDRRLVNGDFEKFFQGRGIDIGCGDDPVRPNAVRFDKEQGDACLVEGFEKESFDWVHSSHCLEHLEIPSLAFTRWWELVKPGGHLILTVPDFVLYEKRVWPSKMNKEHLFHFSPQGLVRIACFLPNAQFIRLQLNDDYFNYNDTESDQTKTGAQAELELILRKVKNPFWATWSTQ